jgi:hypothetical protein
VRSHPLLPLLLRLALLLPLRDDLDYRWDLSLDFVQAHSIVDLR